MRSYTTLLENILLEKAEDGELLLHLKERYAFFNTHYFAGKLPQIPIVMANLKTSGGFVGFQSMTHLGKKHLVPGSMVMKISNKYKRSAEDLELILLHEMIHVYIVAVLGDCDEHHGVSFMKMLAQLSEKTGRRIPIKDDLGGELADDTVKPYAVLVRYVDGKIIYALMSTTSMYKNLDAIKQRFTERPRELVEVRIVSSKLWTEKAAKTTVTRAFNYKMSFFICPPDQAEDLLTHSEVVWSNNFK